MSGCLLEAFNDMAAPPPLMESPSCDRDSGSYCVRPCQGGKLRKGGQVVKYVATSHEKSGEDRNLWVNVKKVLKAVMEIISLIAAIKTILT